jgi:hypothetical protein
MNYWIQVLPDHVGFEPQYTKYVTKKDAVEAENNRLRDIFEPADYKYIIGDKVRYKQLNKSHHEVDLRVLAWYLERFCKGKEEKEKKVLLKMFTWVTG